MDLSFLFSIPFHSSLLLNVVQLQVFVFEVVSIPNTTRSATHTIDQTSIYIMLSYCGFLLSSFAHFICNCNTNSRVVLYVYRQSLGTPNKTNSYRMCAHVCACLRVIVFVCVCISQERERVRALRHMLLL